ncbi:patatin-like phospholipase family protein [Candidatus Gracilibacteria bacterium]|nr:patatin-like phospholipase family protein [Candidatus Gracilibacteria bacterium]MCF7819204.1 patatin-like phospholipase family protein [Candidatus Gracilibacteria bacterium]
MSKKKKAALVCSGGGALGAALVGIVEKLEEKYEFDFYAGTSAGAMLVAFHACGFSGPQIWKILNETNMASLAFDFSEGNFGIIRGEKLSKIFGKHLNEKKFEDLQVPLFIGATNFSNGKRVTLSSGKIIDALRASISVPLVFEPFLHPDRKEWLVDGGLSQNLPLDIALEKYEGKKIFALDTSSLEEDIDFHESKWFGKAGNARKVIGRTLKIFFQNQQTNFPKDSRVQYVRPILSEFSGMDVFRLKQIYEAGKKHAETLDLEQ